MKTVISIFWILFLVASCCSPGSEPKAIYPHPDDVTRYTGHNGYKTITFTYYCRNGRYESYTYTRMDQCADYIASNKYESDGICD